MSGKRRNLAGKVMLVTGASAGIGKATARGLGRSGATVIMVARSRERGEPVLDRIRRETGNQEVSLLPCDLSSQAEVRRLAAEVREAYPALHVLINNAAIVPPERRETVDGLEMQLAVNHLAPFLLTNLLLDLLKASMPARVVTVASQVHRRVAVDFDDMQSEREYHRRVTYSRTKLMNVLFTHELARRTNGSGVTANCLHPGVVGTQLLADYYGDIKAGTVGNTPEEGAETPIYLATSAKVEDVTGQYFVHCQPAAPSDLSQDEETALRLWRVSAELVGMAELAN
jgi:NAD(P)-dependent dehydrogenase (short-subunit alcohol dehydrogenase family)